MIGITSLQPVLISARRLVMTLLQHVWSDLKDHAKKADFTKQQGDLYFAASDATRVCRCLKRCSSVCDKAGTETEGLQAHRCQQGVSRLSCFALGEALMNEDMFCLSSLTETQAERKRRRKESCFTIGLLANKPSMYISRASPSSRLPSLISHKSYCAILFLFLSFSPYR